MDFQKFHSGESFDAYEYFGAHITEHGVVFRVYAPNAQRLSVMGEFTGWQEWEMNSIGGGVWEFGCTGARAGQMYKYIVYSKNWREDSHYLNSLADH